MSGRETNGPPGPGARPGNGPASGPRPAVRPTTGKHPAAPEPSTGSHPTTTPTGSFPAARPSTGAFPAGQPDPPRTGFYPLPNSSKSLDPPTGFYPAKPRKHPTGDIPAPPSNPPATGGFPAVRPTTVKIGGGPPSSGGGAIPPPSEVGVTHPSGIGPPSGVGPGSGVGESSDPEQAPPDPIRLGGPRPPRIGEIFDNYKIRELIGQGNMGRIYRARDRTGRNVAIKVILTEVASGEGLARFQREGQALAKISYHRHVVGVHSNGTIRGMPYLVLDYVQGETLEDALRRGPIPVDQAALVAEKLGRALEHVHQAGVLHRDLKPANILIRSEDGEPVLTDFGLADLKGADRLTQTGDMLGTPLYMAPEQVMGLHKKVDGRTDVWALGVLLYEMVSNTVPFPGTTMVEVSQKITGADPVPLTSVCPEADKSLEGIIARALTKEKDLRTPSPGAMAAALRAWRRAHKHGEAPPPPPPPRGRTKRLVLGGLGLLALLSITTAVIALRTRSGDPQANQTPTEAPTESADPKGSLGEQALAKAQAAVKEKDLQTAADALTGDPIVRHELERMRSTLLSRLELLRIQALQLGRSRVDDDDTAGIRAALTISGFVSDLLQQEASQHDLADSILDLLKTREAKRKYTLEKETIELLDALVSSRLLPSPRAAIGWVEAVFFARGGAVSLDRHNEAYRRAHFRHLVASARLGAWLQHTHLRQWTQMGRWTFDPDRGDESEGCLLHRFRIASLMVQRAHKTRQERTEAYTEFRQFLLRPATKAALGKRERAHALLDLAYDAAGRFDQGILTELQTLDPGNPGVLARTGEQLLKQARQRWKQPGEFQASARDALRVLERALLAYNDRYMRVKTTERVLLLVVENLAEAAVYCSKESRLDLLLEQLKRWDVSLRVQDQLKKHRERATRERERVRADQPPRKDSD